MRKPPTTMPAIVTPFDDQGELDLDAHRHNLAALAGRGMEGYVIGGSTGEGPYLEQGERYALVNAAREELGDGAFLMCGAAGQSVRRAAADIAEAAEAGADAALVLTPTTLVLGNHDAVRAFYAALAATASIPIMLYTIPRLTGYELPVDVAAELLSRRSQVVGIKDSGGHPVRIQQLAAATGGEAYLYTGSSPAIALSVAAGGYGAITASANYAPSLVRDVVAAARKGGVGRAAEPQARLARLTALVEARGLAGTKVAAEIAGLRPGRSRAPLPALAEADAETLRRQLGVLKHQLLG